MTNSEAETRETAIADRVSRIRAEAAHYYAYGLITIKEFVQRYRGAENEATFWWLARQRQIPPRIRRELLMRCCVYCGDESTCVDHIVPVSRGGTRDLDNLAPSCSSCNSDKLDFTPAEWLNYRLEHGYCWPPEPRWVSIAGFLVRYIDDVGLPCSP